MNSYSVWWKEQKPLSLPKNKLTKSFQRFLEKKDEDSISDFYQRIYKAYYYYRSQFEIPYSWLWNLFLEDDPVARKTLRNLLKLHDHYSFRKIVNPSYYVSYQFCVGEKFTLVTTNQHSLRYLKAIYKVAEKNRDPDLWSLLAYRFDAECSYNYSSKTRHYLRRRTWRYLRCLGEKGSEDYVRLATKVLLYYDARDGLYRSFFYRGRYQSFVRYTRLWLFNHLIYHNSDRFHYPSSKYWQDRGSESYMQELPEKREEAFPELWDRHPESLLLLLTEAKASPVIQFAGRALRMGNPDYVRQLPKKLLDQLLTSREPARQAFAVGVLFDQMDPHQPDFKFWLNKMFSKYPKIRTEAKKFVRKHASLWSVDVIENLIRSCNQLLNRRSNMDPRIVDDLIELFEGALWEKIKQVASINLAKSFFNSPHKQLQLFSASILSEIDLDQTLISGEQLLPFFVSDHQKVVEATQKLFEESFTRLSLNGTVLAKMVTISSYPHQSFFLSFFQKHHLWMVPFLSTFLSQLWSYLLKSDANEERKEWILENYFQDLFLEEMKETPLEKILALLEHDNTKYQEFAAKLIRLGDLDPNSLSFSLLLKMAHNRVAAVRKEGRRLIMEIPERITADWMYNLIETDWDDTREWMFAYIRALPADQVKPDLIYGLLDTARKDVQQLAMDLVQKYESILDLKELMLRGSENPDLHVQEYVLHLAEKIDWDEKTMKKMELFFRTVLFRVNRGRKAKKQALHLLLKQCEQSRSMAKVGVPILLDVLRNQGVRDFEVILKSLTRIHIRFPQLPMPIEIVEIK